LEEHSRQEEDPGLTADMHCLGWGYDDELTPNDNDRKGEILWFLSFIIIIILVYLYIIYILYV